VPALFLANSQAPLFLTKQVGSSIIKRDFLHNQLYKRISKIFAISTAIKNNVLQTTPVEKQDVIIMPNGIDIKKFNPDTIDSKKIRSEYNISQDEIVIGMLARFTPGKGHEELLWAAKELNKEFNKLRYIIVGEPSRGESDYAEKIKGLANDYKLDNVLFTGFRSDVPEVLAALDIFAFPSHSEAFGIALVEAMAMKKPSVCSNAEGILDIAINDSTSYLFDNKNAEDLKNKLKLLINSSETRLKFGENSRKRVLNNFDIELLNDKMVKIYSEAIGEIEEQ
jgi:glycosyltransferase involved in cell wall biosynthesis